MLKRVLMLAGAGLLSGALSLVAINHTSAQGPEPGTPQPVNPQFAVIPELGTEEEIPLELVPLAVRAIAQQAANAYVGGGSITSARLDTQRSMPVFELAGTASGGQAFEIDVFQDGMIEEIEQVLDDGEPLPAGVTQAVATYFPTFTATQVARSVRPQHTGLTEVYYEFSGVNAVGDPITISVREDGRLHIVEEDAPPDGGPTTPVPTTATPTQPTRTSTATVVPTTATATQVTTPTAVATTVTATQVITATAPVTGTATATRTLTPTTPVTGTATAITTVTATTPVTGTVTATASPATGTPIP